MTAADVWLFSYGTLQQEDVQIATFGRQLEGRAEDDVPGVVLRITAAELAAADTYEVSDYKRVAVRPRSGLEAFV